MKIQNTKSVKTLTSIVILLSVIAVLFTFSLARGYDHGEKYKGDGKGYGEHMGKDGENMGDYGEHMGKDYGEHMGEYGRKGKFPRGMGMMGGLLNFPSVDENKDDKITREEANALASRIFSDMDTDKDDQINEEEFVNFRSDKANQMAELSDRQIDDERMDAMKKRAKKFFSKMDENDDKMLGKEELFSKQVDKFFEKFDSNNDGSIEKKELDKKLKKRKKY